MVDGARLARVALIAVSAAWPLLFLAGTHAASAYATACEATIDGKDVRAASVPEGAIHLAADQSVTFDVRANDVIENASVSILVGPVPVLTQSLPQSGNARHASGEINVADYATVGTGTYHLLAQVDDCSMEAWVVIDPAGVTPLMAVGAGVVVVGTVTAGAGLAAGARSRGGLGRSIVGGAVLGAGALVVAQQTGAATPETTSAIAWTVLPGAAGGIAHSVLKATRRRSSTRPDTSVASYEPPVLGEPTRGGYAPYDYGQTQAYGQTPSNGAPSAYGQAGGYGQPEMSAPQPTSGSGLGTGPPPPAYVPPPAPLPTAAATSTGAAAALEPPTAGAAVIVGAPSAGVSAPAATTAEVSPPTPTPHAPPAPVATATAAAPAARVTRGGTRARPRAAETAPTPPRESYAHIDSPEAVVAGQSFDLVVGLAAQPDSEVVGGPIVLPERVQGSYTMTIQVIADGFHLANASDSWRVDLPVTGAAPFPTAALRLEADKQDRPVVARTVRAMYSIDGQAVGLAARPIAVVAEASLLATSQPPPAEEPIDVAFPTDQVPPDLTVRIEIGQPAGRLLLQLLAASKDVHLPSDPMEVDIGNEPGLFLRDVIRKMNAAEGQPGMYQILMGIGLTIADQLPTGFFDAIAAVAAAAGDRPPTILFLSAEPYVPWELAVLDTPLNPELPPFLAAQASVGRWALGQRRPKLPPPSHLDIHSMAVVSGVYNLPGWDRLIDAEQEAKEIASRYGAQPVNASSQDVRLLVSGQPPAELMHFAVHGQYDPNGEIDGIVLVDGLTLDPMQVRGSPLAAHPFVFLNACQVGSGEAVLGDYAGMAEAFLFAGASGVIAPLWSIDDVAAREIALRFYEKALEGRAPADILREERAAFRNDPSTISSTYLAYQYFGHPHMTLARAST